MGAAAWLVAPAAVVEGERGKLGVRSTWGLAQSRVEPVIDARWLRVANGTWRLTRVYTPNIRLNDRDVYFVRIDDGDEDEDGTRSIDLASEPETRELVTSATEKTGIPYLSCYQSTYY